MSGKTILFVLGIAVLALVLYTVRDRIPSPSVSAQRPYSAPNGHKVVPLGNGPGRFEVLDTPGAMGRGYFCAAARYAEAVLRAETRDHVRVIAELGPSQTQDNRRAVGFELVPAAEVADSETTNISAPRIDQTGESRSIVVSRQFCA
ncbi:MULTISPECIES: hypothetical protein [Dinoroseobacter]|jgi:hypothetical protein|uniref:hypothetical protein n=1 Tax=Dinoroseobacter TaxID=309512 RepID=UPI0000E92ED3|nr:MULTISPECIES: hypothetical protein [Dinoroseobacter]MDD9716490.1 hypothetical protein [Dinoroseobacter sp. PD6]URF45440.1 hypothetical protein M8008_11670 [Dinoroseobacter shibae]URF49745.1 hypothetical protein M8007_11670 [Dinoroseobacter shibae]